MAMNSGELEYKVRPESILHLLEDARPEQATAIRSLLPLVVVSAGAGTGKTHTLSRRFAWLLASDPSCRVDQILTLTFTKAAAAEMKERIKATLVEWTKRAELPHLYDAIARIDEAYISTINSFAQRVVNESGLELDIDPAASIVSDPVSYEYWEDYRWNLETLQIANLTNSLPTESRTRAVGYLRSEEMIPFLNYYGSQRLAAVAEETEEVFGGRNLMPAEVRERRRSMEEEARGRIIELYADTWDDVWFNWREVIFPVLAARMTDLRGGNLLERVIAFYGKWHELEYKPEHAAEFYSELLLGVFSSINSTNDLKALLEELLGCTIKEYRDRHKKSAELTASLLADSDQKEDRVRELLTESALIGWENWDLFRQRGAVLSFSDQLRYAGRALALNPTYALRFRHIMIDEFQDTDELQDAVVNRIREAWPAAGSPDARTLFIVGDIKQSIYRFRNANPRLMSSYIKRVSGGNDGAHIPLSASFRMSGAVMETVNAIFSHIWQRGVISDRQFTVPYEPLLPPEDAPWWSERNRTDTGSRPWGSAPNPAGDSVPRPRIEGQKIEKTSLSFQAEPEKINDLSNLLTHNPGVRGTSPPAGFGAEPQGLDPMELLLTVKGDLPVARARRKLAAALAERLAGMVGAGLPVWDRQLDGGAFRPVRWRDIAVLVKTRASNLILEEVFDERAIPVTFEQNRGFFNRGEVADMVNLLRLLGNVEDRYSLASWLESPFSTLLPLASTELLAEGRGSSLFEDLKARYPQVAGLLLKMKKIAEVDSPSAAMLTLYTELSWILAYRDDHRNRVLANLQQCIDLIAEYESSFGKNLAACADYLERIMNRDRDIVEPDIPGELQDKVRVLTVHSAKGLEFPLVVVFSPEAVKRGRSVKAEVSRSIVVTSTYMPNLEGDGEVSDETFRSTKNLWHRELDYLGEKQENERLLYVALTRAQERILYCTVVQRDDDSADEGGYRSPTGDDWIDWLLAADRAKGLHLPVEIIDEDNDAGESAGKKRGYGARQDGDAAITEIINVPNYRSSRLNRLSATAYSLFSWCPYAYRLRYRQGRELKWQMPDGDGYGGADLGSLAHWILTKWDFMADTLDDYLPTGLKGAELKEWLTNLPAYLRPVFSSGADRKILHEWLSGFALTPIAAELREYKEKRMLQHEVSFSVSFNNSVINGSIDLYWEDSELCHIRDWKITGENEASDRLYERQLYFYALAVWLLKKKEVDVGLIRLRPPYASEVSRLRIDSLRGIADHVKYALAAANGQYDMVRQRCDICPFRISCKRSGQRII